MPSIEMPAMVSELSEVSRLHRLLELSDYSKNERRAFFWMLLVSAANKKVTATGAC